jgi:hypothetical protein
LWTAGQDRIRREHDDILTLTHIGTREGMTDVYVALKRLRRRGRPASMRGQQHGLTGAELEHAVDALGLTFPGRVTEVAA